MDIDKALEQLGFKGTYDDLNAAERETLHKWLDNLQTQTVSLEKVREYIESMRDAVVIELSDYKNGSAQDMFCKARLRNYTLLLGMLSAPEKARKALQLALQGVKK